MNVIRSYIFGVIIRSTFVGIIKVGRCCFVSLFIESSKRLVLGFLNFNISYLVTVLGGFIIVFDCGFSCVLF